MKFTRLCAAAIGALLLSATSSFAHVDPRLAGNGFGAGLAHPIAGWDHLLAMVGIGLLGAKLGGRAIWALPLAFIAAMLGGQLLGWFGYAIPMVELGIAASLVLVGFLIVMNSSHRLVLLAMLTAVFGLMHGHAHGNEMAAISAGAAYSIGLLLMTCVLHTIGILAGLWACRTQTGLQAIRWAGAAVATAGIYLAIVV